MLIMKVVEQRCRKLAVIKLSPQRNLINWLNVDKRCYRGYNEKKIESYQALNLDNNNEIFKRKVGRSPPPITFYILFQCAESKKQLCFYQNPIVKNMSSFFPTLQAEQLNKVELEGADCILLKRLIFNQQSLPHLEKLSREPFYAERFNLENLMIYRVADSRLKSADDITEFVDPVIFSFLPLENRQPRLGKQRFTISRLFRTVRLAPPGDTTDRAPYQLFKT